MRNPRRVLEEVRAAIEPGGMPQSVCIAGALEDVERAPHTLMDSPAVLEIIAVQH